METMLSYHLGISRQSNKLKINLCLQRGNIGSRRIIETLVPTYKFVVYRKVCCLQEVTMSGSFMSAKTIWVVWCVIQAHLFGSNLSRLASPIIMQKMETVLLPARGKELAATRTQIQNTSTWLQALSGRTKLLFRSKLSRAMEKRP